MKNILSEVPTAEEVSQMQQAIQQYLLEIEQLRERMRYDQAQIEASGVRTDTMLTQIQTALVKLQAR